MEQKIPPLKNLRGFPDIMPDKALRWDRLLNLCEKTLESFDFERVDPPILEPSSLFMRTLGHGSDIVSKEMYSLQKEGESLSLRPEGTAGLARMLITQGAWNGQALRWYYKGPMFRHERPQKGRFRQFFQLGAELFGESGPQADAQMLSLAHLLLKNLPLSGKVVLEINSLGSVEERSSYSKKFKDFLQSKKSHLSRQSLVRLQKNPLRIWDSKEAKDQEILKSAPLLSESLKAPSREGFEKTKDLLNRLKIPFEENPRLVRGLDYYSGLVFEFKSGNLGAQSAILAGGRYDHLIEDLGGPCIPAVGWALGLDRLSLLAPPFKKEKQKIGLVAVGDKAQSEGFYLAYMLRQAGFGVCFRFSGNFSKQIKRAAPKCRLALIIGAKEMKQNQAVLKNLETGEQSLAPLSPPAGLIEKLKKTV